MSLLFWNWNVWLPVSKVSLGYQVLSELILSPQFIVGQECPLAVPQSTGLCQIFDLEFLITVSLHPPLLSEEVLDTQPCFLLSH